MNIFLKIFKEEDEAYIEDDKGFTRVSDSESTSSAKGESWIKL